MHKAALALVGVAVLTACSSSPKTRAFPPAPTLVAPSAAEPTTGPTPASGAPSPAGSAAPSSGTTTPASGAASASTACTAGGPIPGGAARRQIPDVDGDGRADTGFLYLAGDGTPVIGVHAAAGGTFVADFSSASGAQRRTVTFARISRTGPVVALTDDNRQSQLFVVKGCLLEPARNVKGKPYQFDLRDFGGNGDGVTCGSVGGGARTLVGFHYARNAAGTRTGGETRTEILLGGVTGPGAVTATNGTSRKVSTVTRPDGISCGDVTEASSGIELSAQ